VKVGVLDDEFIGVGTSERTGEQPPCRFDAILFRGLRHADTRYVNRRMGGSWDTSSQRALSPAPPVRSDLEGVAQ
jgi:hypothetical protein